MKFCQLQIVVLIILSVIQGHQCISNPSFKPQNVVYAVDCGSMVATSSQRGFKYLADTGYSSGKISDYSFNSETQNQVIAYTYDQNIYFTERHDDQSFQYRIPLKKQGVHVLILQFTEMYFGKPGKRVFNIKLGDQRVVYNLDIVKQVGQFAAYDEYIEFELKNNLIYHNGDLCPQAFNIQSQQLIVEFEKIGIDNPKVDGIILYKGDLKDVGFTEVTSQRRQWDQKQKEELKQREIERLKKEASIQRRVEKKKIRNDYANDEDNDVENIQVLEQQKSNIFSHPLLFYGLLVFVGLAVIYSPNLSQKKTVPSDYLEETTKITKMQQDKSTIAHKKGILKNKN